MEETDKAWLAGFIDGEGSIGLARSLMNGKYTSYSIQIQITNCNKIVMERICLLYKDLGIKHRVTVVERQRKGYIGSEYYLNNARHKDVKLILETVLPYLICKKPQAEIALKYVNERLNCIIKNNNQRKNSYSGTEGQYYEQFKQLNAKRRRVK